MTSRTGIQPVARHGFPRGRRLPVALGILLTALLGLALSAVAAAGAASAAAGQGKIYVIHGIAGQTLDIYVDGEEVKPGAKPKTIVGPLSLNAGSHQVSLRNGVKTVASAKFKVGSGQSLDVIAHLRSDSSMGATVTAYRNDLSSVAPGKLRLVVAHVAAAPPADIRVNGDVLFSNVANGEALTTVVPSGRYQVGIVPAGTNGQAILGPVTLPLKKGTLTRVFAIGSVATGSMDAIVHSLPVKVSGAAAPRSVPTGNGGQAATEFVSDRRSVATEVMMGSALFLLAAGGVVGLAGRRMRKRATL